MTNQELKPCPFCGPNESIVSLYLDDVAQRHRVGCGRCGASTGIHPRDTSETPAIAAWNKRQPAMPVGYITPAAVELLREGRFVSLCPTAIDKGLPVYLAPQPNPPESPDSCDAHRLVSTTGCDDQYLPDRSTESQDQEKNDRRWRKARTLPRSWYRDAFNRIAAEGATLDELIDAEMRRKLP